MNIGFTARYTAGLHAMMYYYNSSMRGFIVNSGRIDGSCGNGTAHAVKAYQAA